MLTALLIIARTAQIAASILIAGIFTFELVALGLAGRPARGDLHDVRAALVSRGRLESGHGAPLSSALVLAGSREHEWIGAHERFFRNSVANGFG